MVDFAKFVGFPFSFDIDEWQLLYPKDYFSLTSRKVFTIDSTTIRRYYLNPVTVLISKIYATFWITGKAGIWKEMPFRFKFVILNKDYVGIETIKTKTIHVKQNPRILDIIYGTVKIILFPKNINEKFLSDDNSNIVITTLKTGDKMIIPAGYIYTIVNINPADFAAILEVHHSEHPKNTLFNKTKGAPFYFVLRNTSHEIVKNPQYRFINKYAKLEQGRLKLLKKYNVSPKTPILKQITRKVLSFTQLLTDTNTYDIANDIINNIDEIVEFSHPRF